MRRLIFVPASLLAVALAMLAALAGQASAVAPAPAVPSASASAGANRTADQMALWEGLPAAEWDQALEEGCVEHGGPVCGLTRAQLDAVLPDVQKQTAALVEEVRSDPALTAPLHHAGPRARGAGDAIAVVARNIAAHSGNPAVRNTAGYADKIADFAGHVSNATYAHDGLTQSTAEAVAKSALYAMPLLGDVFSLAEAVNNQDLESGIVATISLAGTMVATVFPPAGAVVAVGLAVYYVGKMIWGWLTGQSRNWETDPPGDPREIFQNGADLRWESRLIEGKYVGLALTTLPGDYAGSPWRWAHAKLLIDSRWPDPATAKNDPVTYTLDKITLDGLRDGNLPRFVVWQDGKQVGGTCTPSSSSWLQGTKLVCTPRQKVTIAKDHPALVRIDYKYFAKREAHTWKWWCESDAAPCLPTDYAAFTSVASVRAASGTRYELSVPFGFGDVPDSVSAQTPDID